MEDLKLKMETVKDLLSKQETNSALVELVGIVESLISSVESLNRNASLMSSIHRIYK